MRNVLIFEISAEDLVAIFETFGKFPEGTKIEHIEWDFYRDKFCIKANHPSFPEKLEGAACERRNLVDKNW